jgi:hypothetical protein
VHRTLHDFHVEGGELDAPTPNSNRSTAIVRTKTLTGGWRYTEAEKKVLQAQHLVFVARLVGNPFGMRYTDED